MLHTADSSSRIIVSSRRGRWTLRALLREAGLTVDEFVALL